MLLRSRISRASRPSCTDCLGSTSPVNGIANTVAQRSLFGRLVHAAELGWMPDILVRSGIRRLLHSRLRTNQLSHSDRTLDDFIRATQIQPIAVAQEKANQQHYEVPVEFFQQVLGPRLKYSCCHWSETTPTLGQAEDEALSITCERADLKDGMQILELGCGWGSLSLAMAEQFPNSSITAVSNSNSQRQFIQSQARSRDLTNLTVITADMANFMPHTLYDRVVSVEMFEHMRNHRRLMDRIHGWLTPQGKLFVHIFCHQDTPYLFRSDAEQNWMGRHFFSGGMMPSADLLPRCGSAFKLAEQWIWNGSHYAKTCRAWLQNQDAAKARVLDIFQSSGEGEQAIVWHNRWRMFFLACDELFSFNEGREWFVAHYLFER